RRVATRAVTVEAADRDVVIRQPGDRNRVARWRSGERSGARSVTGETPGHALVRTGHRVERVVARRGMALGTGGGCRDVIGGLPAARDVARGGGRGRMTAVAVARGRMVLVERCRGT